MNSSAEHQRLLRLATRASLAVASILILTKAVAWWLSGSVSLLAGLTDSALDGVASFLNLLAVHYALRPADDDHRYGHGKAEAMAGMACRPKLKASRKARVRNGFMARSLSNTAKGKDSL